MKETTHQKSLGVSTNKGKESHEQSVENELEVGWKGREVVRVVWSPLWYISREIMMTWPRVMGCVK